MCDDDFDKRYDDTEQAIFSSARHMVEILDLNEAGELRDGELGDPFMLAKHGLMGACWDHGVVLSELDEDGEPRNCGYVPPMTAYEVELALRKEMPGLFETTGEDGEKVEPWTVEP